MTLDEIRELVQVVNESGIAELEVQRGDNRVRIKRSGVSGEMFVPVSSQAQNAPMTVPVNAMPVPAAGHAPASAAAAPAADSDTVLVRSPIVGTFYESPQPGAPVFVKVGDTVQPGQVLCIIESMKLMNEIEAEVAGVVLARLVKNGDPVEYGEALFSLRPV